MQTRIDSLMEAVTNTTIGLSISTIANWTVTPAVLGHPLTLAQNVTLSAAFTVISIARSYTLRRIFDGRTPWQALRSVGSRLLQNRKSLSRTFGEQIASRTPHHD